jgi:ATP-binding cassette subfamily B protein/subfamily B ATP-binding cassette protein MsbA
MYGWVLNLAGHRRRLAVIALLTTASSLLMLAVPWLSGSLLGDLVSRIGQDLPWIAGGLILALVLIALIQMAVAYVTAKASAELLASLRGRLYDHVQSLPVGFHEARHQGDLLALLTFEISRLSDFLTDTLIHVPARLLTVSGAVILMFAIDARLALIVPVLIPAFYLILKIVGRRLRGLAIQLQQAEAEVVWTAEEGLDMLPATKAFAREGEFSAKYGSRVERAMALTIDQGRIYALLEPLIGLVASVAAVLVLVLAGQQLRTGTMTPSELFIFIFYAALLTRPVSALAHLYGQVQTARGTLARLGSVLGEEPESNYSTGIKIGRAKGAVTFLDISFHYPGREPVLDNLNLEISAGEAVALIGSNGVGKTTLVNLLMRFYDPISGTISLDGTDIAQLRLQDLRRQIGVVPQRALLFNGPVRDNILFGRNASPVQLEAAAALAQASSFIAELPDGIDTIVGDNGVRLSGGQRQRIALARALLDDPPILILDEATSMYDLEGESAFVEACASALRSRTVIIITHRPATLALADRLVQIEDGKAVDVSVSREAYTRAG